MPKGPGKYDEIATIARQLTEADGIVVLVRGGSQGDGFAVQCVDPGFVFTLPAVLRSVADQVERDLAGGSVRLD